MRPEKSRIERQYVVEITSLAVGLRQGMFLCRGRLGDDAMTGCRGCFNSAPRHPSSFRARPRYRATLSPRVTRARGGGAAGGPVAGRSRLGFGEPVGAKSGAAGTGGVSRVAPPCLTPSPRSAYVLGHFSATTVGSGDPACPSHSDRGGGEWDFPNRLPEMYAGQSEPDMRNSTWPGVRDST